MTAPPQAAGNEGVAHPVVALPTNLRAGSWHTAIVSSANLTVVALPANARASSPDASRLVAPDAFRQHVVGILGEYAGDAFGNGGGSALRNPPPGPAVAVDEPLRRVGVPLQIRWRGRKAAVADITAFTGQRGRQVG